MISAVALVAVFARLERPRPARYVGAARNASITNGIGTALLSIAVFGVACSNVADLLANSRIDLAVVPVTPLQLVVATLIGVALVRRAASRVAQS